MYDWQDKRKEMYMMLSAKPTLQLCQCMALVRWPDMISPVLQSVRW